MNRVKILLGHLNSLGDCLYATVIARQIKEVNFPNCHLTWGVSNKSLQAVMFNPHVDEVWEISTPSPFSLEAEWDNFVHMAEERKRKGDFDIIFYTQIIKENILNFDGGIRSSTYNNYSHQITISQQPIIRLSEKEVEVVKKFADTHKLHNYKNIILVECGSQSFKSFLNQASALELAIKIVANQRSTAIILSSNRKIKSPYPEIIDGSVLSFRENAELTKYCTLFIGCSSGISWLTTTDWAKPLPKVILTDYTARICSSMIYDHEYSGISTNEIIELQEDNAVLRKLYDCIHLIMSDNFIEAKKIYKKPAKLKNYSFVYRIGREGFRRLKLAAPLQVFKRSNKRNGFSYIALLYLLKAYLKMPFYLIKIGVDAMLLPQKKKRVN